jgi:hypothetical protein
MVELSIDTGARYSFLRSWAVPELELSFDGAGIGVTGESFETAKARVHIRFNDDLQELVTVTMDVHRAALGLTPTAGGIGMDAIQSIRLDGDRAVIGVKSHDEWQAQQCRCLERINAMQRDSSL